MDIRNFFAPKGGKGPKQRKSSHDDGDDFAPKTKARKKKTKGIIFESDSSDEDPLPRKVKKRLESSDTIPASDEESSHKTKSKSSSKSADSRKRKEKIPEPGMKEITPDSFFGSCSKVVKKEKRLAKRKASDDNDNTISQQVITIDDDDLDFDGTLNMTPKKKIKREPKTEPREKTLSSKLSDMAKKTKPGKSSIKEEKTKSVPKVKDDIPERPSKTPEKSRKKSDDKNVPTGLDEKSKKELTESKLDSTEKAVKKAKDKKQLSELEQKKPKSESDNITPSKSKKKISPLKEKKSNTPRKITPEKAKKPEHDSEQGEKESSSKQQRYMKYMQWQNRGGAKAPGSKEIPEGADNCLEGLTFVITGILESLEREEAKSLIERYGGKVTGNVSGRTSYVIVGDDPGDSKIRKAEQHKTKQIDEDGLLELIKTKPGKKSKYEVAAEKAIETESKAAAKQKAKTPKKKMEAPEEKTSEQKKEMSSPSFYGKKKTQASSSKSADGGAGDSQESVASLSDSQKLTASSHGDTENMLWVDKYKPKTVKQIIGQQGAKSNVEKLKQWLLDWHKNNRPQDGSKPKPKPKVNMWGGGGDPTGAGFKAALLSGPPGVGKTTAATLVCQELGFQYIELNASDTRSKKTLKEEVSQMLDNASIASMFGTETQKRTAMEATKNALIMDEIDGMAGNADRGGMAEVIQLIKTTKIPIICMCNDRSSPKIRSLTNHCFDLRFQRPRVEQITGAMMSICFKEGIKIQAPALQALIRGCNQDVRQVLYNLSMMKASNKTVSYDEAKKQGDDSHKDVAMGIFDVARKLLTSESASLSINEKLSLFFMDYSMIPLFVQDNYPHIRTSSAAGNIHKQLSALTKAADSISLADRLDKVMRSDQSWGALPTLGLLSTVIPCNIMRGGMSGMINFPSFFGKLSTTGKNHRLLQDLKFHSSLTTEGANEEIFNTDYLPYLRWHLTNPLIEQTKTGESEAHKTSALLDAYDLLREDFDSIIDIGQYPGKPQPMAKVDSKVKAAFTRAFNKESHMTPYAVQAVAKKSRKATVTDDLSYGMEDEESQNVEEEENDDDVDAMVKAKPVRKKSTAASSSKIGKKSDKTGGKKTKKK